MGSASFQLLGKVSGGNKFYIIQTQLVERTYCERKPCPVYSAQLWPQQQQCEGDTIITTLSAMVVATRLARHLVKRGGAVLQCHGGFYLQCHGNVYGPSYRLVSTSLTRHTNQTSRGDRVGPDRILPSSSLSTTWPDGAVEIRFSDKHPLCQEKPISVSILHIRFMSKFKLG